jgi:hypothetical protein
VVVLRGYSRSERRATRPAGCAAQASRQLVPRFVEGAAVDAGQAVRSLLGTKPQERALACRAKEEGNDQQSDTRKASLAGTGWPLPGALPSAGSEQQQFGMEPSRPLA